MPSAEDFRRELTRQIVRAEKQGRSHIEVNAGELHRAVGEYPSEQLHRMPICCRIMREEMREELGDEVVFKTKSGQSASLTIRYHLPRH